MRITKRPKLLFFCILVFFVFCQQTELRAQSDDDVAFVKYDGDYGVYTFKIKSEQFDERILAHGESYARHLENKYSSVGNIDQVIITENTRDILIVINRETPQEQVLNILRDFNIAITKIEEN